MNANPLFAPLFAFFLLPAMVYGQTGHPPLPDLENISLDVVFGSTMAYPTSPNALTQGVGSGSFLRSGKFKRFQTWTKYGVMIGFGAGALVGIVTAVGYDTRRAELAAPVAQMLVIFAYSAVGMVIGGIGGIVGFIIFDSWKDESDFKEYASGLARISPEVPVSRVRKAP